MGDMREEFDAFKEYKKEKRSKIEPNRFDTTINKITSLGYSVDAYTKHIEFVHKGFLVMYYPYSGWATGISIKDGRGLKNLLKQLIKE